MVEGKLADASMRVLIVEDDADLRTLLGATVSGHGFEVSEAGDGEEAWELLQTQHFPIVITDWFMPNMDGIELIRAMREKSPQPYSYIIMLTAASDADAFQRGMAAGADDLLRKPWHSEELLARLHAARRIMRLGQELAQANRTLLRSNRKLEFFRERVLRELEGAARVQASLLPRESTKVPGMKVSWSLVPCEELAGDVLNVLRLDETHVGLYVVDVSGHGVSAALLSAQLSRLMHPQIAQSHLLKRPEAGQPGYRLQLPSVVMEELNELFPMDPAEPQFFTLIYGILDTESRRFVFSSAGHPGPIHQGGDGEPRVLQVSGTPIGMLRSGSWTDEVLELANGDRFALISDGLLEAMSPEGEMFGDRRILEVFSESRELPLGTCCGMVMENLERWCGTRHLQDDCSLLMIEVE